jgi:hypothetical protein
MDRRNIELSLAVGVRVLAVTGLASVCYLFYLGFGGWFTQDPWPPKDEHEEKQIIARYKQKLLRGDSPLSPRTPEDTALYLGRIIDHEVKTGQMKSGWEYITQAIQQKLDGRVESIATKAESRALIAKLRSGVEKQDGLARVVAHYERRPAEAAGQEVRDRFDQDLRALSAKFCGAPFDPAACPELAEEMATTYKAKLEGAKCDPRLWEVVEEVERNCLPRQPKEGHAVLR